MKFSLFLVLLASITYLKSDSAQAYTVGNAPFCLVDQGGYGAQCFYYDMQSCQMAAQGTNSFCTFRGGQ